jgi:hypothetical protein
LLGRAEIRLIKTASTWRVLVKTNVMRKAVKFQGKLHLVTPAYLGDQMFVFKNGYLYSLGKVIPPEEPNLVIEEYDAVFTRVEELLSIFSSEKLIGQVHLMTHPDCCGEKIIEDEKRILWLGEPSDFAKYLKMFLKGTSITVLQCHKNTQVTDFIKSLGFTEKMKGYWTINLGEDEPI